MSWPSAPAPVRAGQTGADSSAGSACSLGRLGVLVASSVTTHHRRLCRPGNPGTGHITNGNVGGLADSGSGCPQAGARRRPSTMLAASRRAQKSPEPFDRVSEPDGDVGAFAAGGFEVRLGPEPADASDDVGRHRLHGRVQRLDRAVVELPGVRDLVLGAGQLMLRLCSARGAPGSDARPDARARHVLGRRCRSGRYAAGARDARGD